MNLLLQELSGKNVTDLNITDPSIDEIFMGYYSKDADREEAVR